MNARTRSTWVTLALGPCRSRRTLLAVADPRARLRSSWPDRRAYLEWPPAETEDQLLSAVDQVLARLDRRGARALLAFEPGYPESLHTWPLAPSVLFCWGALPAGPWVALVGSRAAAASALRASQQLGGDLARAGCCVLSGGAIGVDGAAHEGALAAGGQSVAVLGSGLDHLYPERHALLFARMAGQGAVLSPFAPWTRPRPWQFPRRNQVMARLARLVVVVEAGARSGALITAKLARAAGVTVLARPGSPGADKLLREGVGLVNSAEDVLGVLAGGAARRVPARPADPDAARLLEELRARARADIDELAAALGWRTPRTAVALMRLQLQGFVELLPGGRYAALGEV